MKDNNEKSSRKMDIKFSHNKLETYLSLCYSPDADGNYPPKFSSYEIKKELSQAGVVYGLIEENIEKCTKQQEVESILIAKGEDTIEGKDDVLDIKFEVDRDIKKLNEDSTGRVDFKSIGSVNSILKGQVLAALIKGAEGVPGKDVTGKLIKPGINKRIKLKASQGCELIKENTIIASIDGKPSMRNNTFYVYKIHEVPQDVDIKTGNIAFLGDITILGSVKEGMKVFSDNSITIRQNVERAEAKGKGDIIIHGSAIGANIAAGGEDTEKLKEIESLEQFEKCVKEMVAAIEEIKKFNLLGYNTSDGQIIKLLIESKFKTIPKLYLSLITQSVKDRQKEDYGLEEIMNFVKTKLIGLTPLNIKHYSEMFNFLELLRVRLKILKASLAIPVNVKLSYSQDSEIMSSGDIIVSGRGVYVSNLTAYSNVYIIGQGAVVRGGFIKAGNEIKCRQVGGPGGVTTKLAVGQRGHIRVDIAYENTLFVVGNREFSLDYASKNVHAYINESNEFIVDKLKL
jgi:uncharacterized protein